MASTVKTASCLGAGQTAIAGAIPAKVAALMDGVLKSMLLAKLKIATAVVLIVGMLGGGLLAPLALSEPLAQTQPNPKATKAEQPRPQARKEQPRIDRYGDPLPPDAVARLGSLRLHHGQQVHRVTLSPDGKWVISTAMDGNRLWDAVTGRERPLRAELRLAAIFSTRDKLLAVEKQKDDLQLWEVVSGEKVGGLVSGAKMGQLPNWFPPLGLWFALAPDGRTLVIATSSVLRFCDVARGQVEEPIPLHRGKDSQTRMAFSADSKTLVLQCDDAMVRVWDVPRRTEKLASRSSANDYAGDQIALSPDGTILATAPFAGKRIRLWDTRTLKELPPLLDQPESTLWPVSFSPDGKLLAAIDSGSEVRLWDLATRKVKRQLQGKSSIMHAVFSADGKTLAGADGTDVTLWDVATGKFRHDFGHIYTIDSLHFSPDGRRLVSGAAYTESSAFGIP